MRETFRWFLLALCCAGVMSATDRPCPAVSQRAQARLMREVRHELVMLPYYGVFDNLAFRVDGYRVTLLG